MIKLNLVGKAYLEVISQMLMYVKKTENYVMNN